MRDLSNDDDFISHLLVEKLGTGIVPLYVHKMDPGKRLPKTNTQELLQIVRRLVLYKGSLQNAIRQAVDDLITFPAVRYYLKSYTQKQINAFATHASRYFELYNPSGSIEIAHTSRYSERTGKSELCILATRSMAPGTVITELKGSMANLTDDEDRELKRAGLRNGDIRRDFSVIHSKSMKKNHLFLGPARFVNHDCNNNCELFREGRYITFRVLRQINIGEEITAHYGDGYFGRKNRHCLCETCEKNGRGGYAPEQDDESGEPSDSSSNSDSDSDSEASGPDSKPNVPLNVNERRTRRGVYAIVTREEESDESENEEDNKVPLANAEDIPADGEIELTTEVDTASELTSHAPSILPGPSSSSGHLTPVSEPLARFSSSLSSISSTGDASPRSDSCTPFRSIISTRRQKAQDVTSNLDKQVSSREENPSTTSKRVTRSASALVSVEPIKNKGKGKAGNSATPSETPKRGQPSTAGRESLPIKKEDVEARVLRTRPAPPAASEPVKVASKPATPRGPDGKQLPTCATCGNILPLISVDSKVVWGLGLENGKKRKKQDCPRCLRHFAIYNYPWPRRLPAHGAAFSVTPREDSIPLEVNKRVTQKTLPVLDHKLAVAACASKRSRKDDAREEEPPSKRQKTDLQPAVIKQKQVISAVTKATSRIAISSSSASRNTTPPNKGSISSKSALAQPSSAESVKRKRGRPRLSDKLLNAIPVIKTEESVTQIPLKSNLSQPRNTNGRFGRKDTLLKAQQRAARGFTVSSSEGGSPRKEKPEPVHATRSSPRKKRENEDPSHNEEYPRKKLSLEADTSKDESRSLQKVLPRASTFKGASLVSRPNPLRFASHAWANSVLQDEVSSSEDERGPETPEDHLSPPAPTIIDLDREDQHLPLSTPSLSHGSLTYKPSPFAFAKRRWASSSTLSSPLEGNHEKVEHSEIKTPVADRIGRRSHSVHTQGYDPSRDEDNSDVTTTPSDNFICPSNTPSEDEAAMELVQIYPVVAKSHHLIQRPMQFRSHVYSSNTKPSFIHAGWDNAYSDISDA